MLRFLYLLSLLFMLCIELSFCYNYIDEANLNRNLNKLGRNDRRERINRVRRPKERKSLVRQEFDYDRSPVAFDVASFIQPDEETFDDDESNRHRNKKRRRTSKSYDYSNVLGVNIEDSKKKEKNTDYLNMGDSPPDLSNPPLFKDAINTKHINNYNSLDDFHSEKYGHEKFRNIYKDDLLMDQNILHNHEKKCTVKRLKFPFFSHNKSESIKSKKNKKRKLFSFNSAKKEDHGLKLPDSNKMNDDPMMHYKMKRSFEERLCPACKKIYLVDLEQEQGERHKKTPKRIIHNSRQFYQSNDPDAKLNENVKNVRKTNVLYSTQVLNDYYRKKRDDRERQLKELEEVQRKIDNVEIRLPTFVKPIDIK